MKDYKGWEEMTDPDRIAAFYGGHYQDLELKENEYCIIKNDVYKYQNGFCKRVDYPIINNNWSNPIKPKDSYQMAAMDMLKDRRSTVKMIRGVYGSGWRI